MRQDQFETLQKRIEQLTDVFIEESDSDRWPGAGVATEAMDKQTRGDRYWVKKNAVATLAVVQRIASLVVQIRTGSSSVEPTGVDIQEGEDELDKQIAEAEKEAAALMNETLQAAQKRGFDKRVHGKP